MLTSIAAAAVALSACQLVSAIPFEILSRQADLLAPPYDSYINASKPSGPVALHISTKSGARNATAPLLYGWQIEDISHSIEGGLYAELISNRAFQGSTSLDGSLGEITLRGWKPIGGAILALELERHPLTPQVPNAMKVTFPEDATGEVGFENYGFFGMNVAPQTYNASFYIQPADYIVAENLANCQATISLRSNVTDEVFFSQAVNLPATSEGNWTKVSQNFQNTVQAPSSNNTFAITFDGAQLAGKTIFITFVSLFPETFHGYKNGLRKDLGELIYDLKPTFLRMPGGNNIEGQNIPNRWIWNETIGPVENRVARQGDWGYLNTNGFGLLEFLEWCETMELEPVMAIYSGYSLGGQSVPEDEMGPILQSALDQIEYTLGDVSTTWGARRAADGHPEPFNLTYLELGNEDWFSDSYPYRFPILYNGISEKYPQLQLISTTFDEANKTFNYTIDLPPGIMWDTHHYEPPSFYLNQFNFFDNWGALTNNTDVTILVGEYSNFQLDTPDVMTNFSKPYLAPHVFFPQVLSAVSEAIYLIGIERNPNTVKMTCYAPTFANFDDQIWQPNLVTITANPNDTVLSASYHLQKMFNAFRGDDVIPVTNSVGDFNPLYWVSTLDTTNNLVYLKLANAANTSVPLSVNVDAAYESVNGTILTNPNFIGFNYFDNKTAIVPEVIEGLPQAGADGTFSWSVPAYSVTVLQFNLS